MSNFKSYCNSLTERYRSANEQDDLNSLEGKIIENLGKDSLDLYSIVSDLEAYCARSCRYALAGFISGDIPKVLDLRVVWRISELSNRYREQDLFETARDYGSKNDFLEEISVTDHSSFLERRWATFGSFMCGDVQDLRDSYLVLKTSILRGDVEEDDELEWAAYSCLESLFELLLADNIDETHLVKLGKHAPFEFLNTDSWNDEVHFKSGVLKALEWHYKECEKSLNDEWYNYFKEPYSVLPTWLLVVINCWESEHNKMLSVNEPIISLGREVFKSLKTASSSSILLEHLENEYRRRFNANLIEIRDYWIKFLS